MGCDIHMVAETKSNYDGADWEPMLAPIFKDRFYDPERHPSRFNTPYNFQPYDDRNYALFSVLADVRNSHGIKPISEARGYPDDMHPVTKWLLDGWDFADHSHTWLTLEEVFTYDWSVKSPYPDGTLADSCKDFLQNCNELKSYAGEAYQIRLVFGFDN